MSRLCNFLPFLPLKPPNPNKTTAGVFPPPPFYPRSRVSFQSTARYGSSSSDLKSVLWSSLTHANTLFFVSPARKQREEAKRSLFSSSRTYNVQYVVKNDDSEESLLRGFRSKVSKAGIIGECRRRMVFENNQEKRKRKSRQSAKSDRRRHRPKKAKQSEKKKESRNRKDEDEEEDNWELPEGGIPY